MGKKSDKIEGAGLPWGLYIESFLDREGEEKTDLKRKGGSLNNSFRETFKSLGPERESEKERVKREEES